MHIPDKHLRDTVAAIVAHYQRQSFLATTVTELAVCYHEAHYKLFGIQLILPPGHMLFFVKSSIDGLGKLNAQTLDVIRTRLMALEVEREAFPPNTGDLGRSPAFQSPVEVGQGGTNV